MMATGKKRGTGRGADGTARVEVGKANAFGGELVNVRSFDRAVVAADIAVAKVVGEKDEDAGFG